MKVIDFIDMELDGIDHNDYPDYCDAYIYCATAVLEDGSMRDATEDEVEKLSDDRDLVYELLIKRLY